MAHKSREVIMEITFTITAKELMEVQAKIKYLKAKEETISTTLREICNNVTASKDGYTYKQFERKGSVMYAKIPELETVDLDKYRGDPITAWRLSYVKQFEEL